jgi:hypothetical protein
MHSNDHRGDRPLLVAALLGQLVKSVRGSAHVTQELDLAEFIDASRERKKPTAADSSPVSAWISERRLECRLVFSENADVLFLKGDSAQKEERSPPPARNTRCAASEGGIGCWEAGRAVRPRDDL